MISVKDDSVSIAHLQPGMVVALMVANEAYGDIDKDVVITSGNDARHSETSLHYANAAIDIRTRDLSQQAQTAVTNRIAECLGKDFDVVLEPDHLHIELQPRRR